MAKSVLYSFGGIKYWGVDDSCWDESDARSTELCEALEVLDIQTKTMTSAFGNIKLV